jgi:hypothetical protein
MTHASPRAVIEVRTTAALTAAQWDEIWQITNRFYVTERGFAEDKLRGHRQIALFRARGNRELIGMAALDVYPADFEGRRLIVIFTSHVLLDERFRGQNLVQRLGARTFLRARVSNPFSPIYWLFDTFSYKSYLLLPRNFREFWPRYDQPTPRWEHALIDALAADKYGAAWSPRAGIVARSGHKRLRPQTAPLQEELLRDRHLAFFAAANPGHAEGDMFVCLCPLDMINWLTIGARALGRALKSRAPKAG